MFLFLFVFIYCSVRLNQSERKNSPFCSVFFFFAELNFHEPMNCRFFNIRNFFFFCVEKIKLNSQRAVDFFFITVTAYTYARTIQEVLVHQSHFDQNNLFKFSINSVISLDFRPRTNTINYVSNKCLVLVHSFISINVRPFHFKLELKLNETCFYCYINSLRLRF